MRSEKQIEPSRHNGALPRGPLSLKGKAVSSRNAVTHGLKARDVLLRHESLEQFEQLLQQLEHHASRDPHACDRALTPPPATTPVSSTQLHRPRGKRPRNTFSGNEPKKS